VFIEGIFSLLFWDEDWQLFSLKTLLPAKRRIKRGKDDFRGRNPRDLHISAKEPRKLGLQFRAAFPNSDARAKLSFPNLLKNRHCLGQVAASDKGHYSHANPMFSSRSSLSAKQQKPAWMIRVGR